MTDEDQGVEHEKDPNEWTTGDKPMTGAQASSPGALRRGGEPFDEGLTTAEASKRIDELQ